MCVSVAAICSNNHVRDFVVRTCLLGTQYIYEKEPGLTGLMPRLVWVQSLEVILLIMPCTGLRHIQQLRGI